MGKLILLIEDDDQEQLVLSRYLEFVGAHVVVAGDGEEGMRKAVEERPDLILLDMRLPRLDGWAVIQRIQMHPATSGIPVVAVTGLEIEPERLDAAGFCGYLHKPLAPYRVLEEVERCLGTVSQPPGASEDGAASDGAGPSESPSGRAPGDGTRRKPVHHPGPPTSDRPT